MTTTQCLTSRLLLRHRVVATPLPDTSRGALQLPVCSLSVAAVSLFSENVAPAIFSWWGRTNVTTSHTTACRGTCSKRRRECRCRVRASGHPSLCWADGRSRWQRTGRPVQRRLEGNQYRSRGKHFRLRFAGPGSQQAVRRTDAFFVPLLNLMQNVVR